MKKLWVTYAWKDNEESDVDFVIAELERSGLRIGFDRAQLVAGQRLWPQIEEAITSPDTDGWAIYATSHSLASEPCLEELAYALDHALRSRGSNFPLIGIFPETLPRAQIPSAIATRLYVDLRDKDWKERIVAGLDGVAPRIDTGTILPYGVALQQYDGKPVIEVWPRIGQWAPFFALVPLGGLPRVSLLLPGVRGLVTATGFVMAQEVNMGQWTGRGMNNAVNPQTAAHVFLDDWPLALCFGDNNERHYIEITQPKGQGFKHLSTAPVVQRPLQG